MSPLSHRLATSVIPLLLLAACDGSPTQPEYDPDIPESWAAAVTNPYLPLVPGTTLSYAAETEDGLESIVVEVLAETKSVMGVTATVVRDRVYLDGELVEDTRDWYAQDGEGNVWYVGEEAQEFEDGVLVGTEGSWEWGVDGALPGIIMWADPAGHVGEEYRQEFYEDEAEDWGKVVAVDVSVEVPFGAFDGCVETEDWNGLEPGTLEAKWYCPEIGVVREEALQGGGEIVELLDVTHGS